MKNTLSIAISAILLVVITLLFPSNILGQELPVSVTVGKINTLPNKQVWLPVEVDLNGRSFKTFTTRLMIDPNYIQYIGTVEGESGVNADITLTPVSEGEWRLDYISSAHNIVGEDGVIFYLIFNSIARNYSPVLFWDLSIDDNQVTSTVDNGFVNSEFINVTGKVTFGPNFIPVSNAVVSLVQAETITRTVDISGSYSFIMPMNSTFSLRADIYASTDGAVTSLDAAWVHQCVLGMRFECPSDITDVDHNGITSILDVWYILRKAANYYDPESFAGNWVVYNNGLPYSRMQSDVGHDAPSAIIGNLTFNTPKSFINVAEVQAAQAVRQYSVSMTSINQKLVIDVTSDKAFNSLDFSIMNSQPISLADIQSEGFKVIQNGHNFFMSRPQGATSARIVINMTAPQGTEVSMINLMLDEVMMIPSVVATETVQHVNVENMYVFVPTLHK